MNTKLFHRRTITLGFSVAILIMLAIGIVSYRSAVQFVESAEVVNQTHRILFVLQAVLADLVSAESEVRGYVITTDERFLQLYTTSVTDVEKGVKQLHQLAFDPTIREHLVAFDRLTQARLQRLKVTLQMRRQEGLEAVRDAAGPGKKMMDNLRQVATDIENMERKLLVERDQYAKSLARRTMTVVIVGSLFAILLAIASTGILIADIGHRERLEKEVLEISEREQRRIGQDLHDGVCQHLTGISLFSRSLQQRLAGKSAAEASEAANITSLINDGIEQVRRVTRGLHPVPDEPGGLMIALRELTDSVRSTGKLACLLDCPEPVLISDQVAATNLYRIAQEAVQNTVRHATATAIVVTLRSKDDGIKLSVRDDGCGIPEDRPGKGLGLEIMNYRANTIGATLEVQPGETKGTVVICSLPLGSLV
jgi:signal transduction histidine kinase